MLRVGILLVILRDNGLKGIHQTLSSFGYSTWVTRYIHRVVVFMQRKTRTKIVQKVVKIHTSSLHWKRIVDILQHISALSR